MTAATSDAVTSGYAGRAVWGAFIGGAFVEAGDRRRSRSPAATGRAIARVVSGGPSLVDRAVAEARRAYPAWRTRRPASGPGCCGWWPRRSAPTPTSWPNWRPARSASRAGCRALRRFLLLGRFRLLRGPGRDLARRDHRPGPDRGPGDLRALRRRRRHPAVQLAADPLHQEGRARPGGREHRDHQARGTGAAHRAAADRTGQRGPPARRAQRRPGLAAGPALSAHPQVERITFTGATATGQRVLRSAAEHLTYATMELGGKNAVLVLADADLDAAVTSRSRACSTTRARRARQPRASSSNRHP